MASHHIALEKSYTNVMLTHPAHITLKTLNFGDAVASSIDYQLAGFEIVCQVPMT